MGHHSRSDSTDSQHNYSYYSGPMSYRPAAGFTVNDLGKQGQYNGQSMQRSDSSFSNTDSHNSAISVSYGASDMYRDNSQSSNSTGYTTAYSPLDMDVVNPAALYEPDINYFPSPVDTYSGQSASHTGYPGGSYSADWMTPRTDSAAPYQQSVGSSVTSMSPDARPSG